jgi:hypothetical protein
MPTSPRPQRTDFAIDIPGRYICNGLDEATTSIALGGRPFDLIVVGGGSFGAALAQDLFANDQARVHRILVLEGGPLALPEHVQNMPLQWLGVPPPATSIAQLRSQGLDEQPRAEVWGLAWHSTTPFPGLAYCLGGRSLFFGGWSPQLLDEEMPTAANAPSRWPQAVVDDLNNRYFAESAAQIGTEETNDFIFGSLQNALRLTLFSGVNNGAIADAIPLGNLPDHPVLRSNPNAGAATLRELLGNPPGAAGLSVQELKNLLKLEAPLAVQGQTLPGFFPFNKFSSLPLLIKAVRSAQNEANNDTRKRLMVVPAASSGRSGHRGGNKSGPGTSAGPRQGDRGTRHDRKRPARPQLLRRPARGTAHRPQPHGASALQSHHPNSPQRTGELGGRPAELAGGSAVLQVPPSVRRQRYRPFPHADHGRRPRRSRGRLRS